MEKWPKTHSGKEVVGQRRENLADFVVWIEGRNDPELAYYGLILHYTELTDAQVGTLVDIACTDESDIGTEVAFRIVHELPELAERERNALFARIVASADKTTCSLTLRFVPKLGDWEKPLREVLSQ